MSLWVCTGFDVHWKLIVASERRTRLSNKVQKVLNGEGYNTVESLLEAAREEYDQMISFEASVQEELALAA